MKKFVQVTLGILTAIGGFVDIGDLVASADVGARFRLALAWVVPFSVVGIIVYADMAGRVATVSGRGAFDLVRERLGPVFGGANLAASFFINLLTLAAELAGVAIAMSLVASVHYILLVPLAAFLVWVVIWRMPFETMERIFGLLGLGLLVFVVAVVKAQPNWNALLTAVVHPSVPSSESPLTYAYFAIALVGTAMSPYEVFFFSSGGVEEHWTKTDLNLERANVFVGFPLGGLLTLAIMVAAALAFAPLGISVTHLSQVPLPAALTLGKLGLAVALVGMFAATFGAAIETALSAGYSVAQYFGWQWGKFVEPRRAARFHVLILMSIAVTARFIMTGADPVKVTEYSIVLSAAALPLTYFPILVIANDEGYMGDERNGRIANAFGTVYLVVLVVVALAAIPLMIITKGGG
jgi:manganese transport protein